MLRVMIIFFILAVCAAFLGFGGLAAEFANIAKFLAGLFVVLFVATLIYSLLSGRKTNLPTL